MLAAVTATVAASYLGVAGTVIGAAVASVLTVVGNAVYGHSIQRTGERVRAAVPASARWLPAAASLSAVEPRRPRRVVRRRWWRDTRATRHAPLARAAAPARPGAASRVFAVINVAITSVRADRRAPDQRPVTGQQASGTSLLGTHSAPASPEPHAVHRQITVTATPSVVVTTPAVTHDRDRR